MPDTETVVLDCDNDGDEEVMINEEITEPREKLYQLSSIPLSNVHGSEDVCPHSSLPPPDSQDNHTDYTEIPFFGLLSDTSIPVIATTTKTAPIISLPSSSDTDNTPATMGYINSAILQRKNWELYKVYHQRKKQRASQEDKVVNEDEQENENIDTSNDKTCSKSEEAIDTSSDDFLIASLCKRKPDKEVVPSTKRRRISKSVSDKMPDITFDDNVKLQHLHYLFKALFPFLKQICEEQKVELAMEAKDQG